ncbi:MAG: S1/P1 nuclease [Muribaculaceae bacterium]|nr:S1/P1 nuclease [Muribaculaceae bacterium]
MFKRISFVLALASVCAFQAFSWGQKGHDVTAYIAEQHLTPATRAAVDSIFGGKSIVYWANWLDNASHTPEYAYTKTWHYKNVDKGVRYEEAPANPAGDAVLAIKMAIETLTNPDAAPDTRELALKILVHVTGDLHQPMHMGHATDLGGNRIKVKFHGRDTNLHSVWDAAIPEAAHKWGFMEWQAMIDRETPESERAIMQGTPDDWAKETIAITGDVYEAMPDGTNIGYDEVAFWTPVIDQQLLRGGLRLSHLLNTIFDPGYSLK